MPEELIDTLLREVRNADLHSEAADELSSLLADFLAEEIPDDGSYTYDDDTGTAQRYMIGGFGPTTYVVFVQFPDEDPFGYIKYIGSQGTAVVAIPATVVWELRSRLYRDAKARNAR